MTPDPVKEAKHSTPLHLEIATKGLMYECIAGSQLTGTNLDESDHDTLGVCIEPASYTLGLKKFEQYVGRSKPMGARSLPGDTDRTIYSLRKWASLALSGNPSVLQLLFVPREMELHADPWFWKWQECHEWFASKQAGKAFLGYMQQQTQRLKGERGQKNIKRPELEAAHGFDTKYAAHIIRLGFQGTEFLTYGYLTLPMAHNEREAVVEIRQGKWSLEDVILRAESMEDVIKHLFDHSPLPDQPDREAVSRELVNTYREWYDTRGWK